MADELRRWVSGRARELRVHQTPQEQQLWQELRAKRFAGFKFRRQEPIGRYIVDFVCFWARLVIELDGGQHGENVPHDENRDGWLREQGFTVLRFWNSDWTAHKESVLEKIWQELNKQQGTPSPTPPP
jgi:very-short-patch-repair endonuclease